MFTGKPVFGWVIEFLKRGGLRNNMAHPYRSMRPMPYRSSVDTGGVCLKTVRLEEERSNIPFTRGWMLARFCFVLLSSCQCCGRIEVHHTSSPSLSPFEHANSAVYVLVHTCWHRLQVYEPGGLLTDIRDRVKEFMGKHNEEFPAKKVNRSFGT